MLCVIEMKMVNNAKVNLVSLGKSLFTSDCNNSAMYCFINVLTKLKKIMPLAYVLSVRMVAAGN